MTAACTRCECTSLTGEAGAAFCARCGHPAADHGVASPPAGSSRPCLTCACPGLVGDEEARFCARCGHHADAHPHPDGQAETAAAETAATTLGGCRQCGCDGFLGEGEHCGRCGHPAGQHVRPDAEQEHGREAPPATVDQRRPPVAMAGAGGWSPQAMTGLAVAIVLALGGLAVLAGAVAWWLTQGGEAAPPGSTAPSAPAPSSGPAHPDLTVAGVVDGETLAMADHTRVHLAQIDAPVLAGCYGRDARLALAALLPPGSVVELGVDPRLPGTDRAHRLVRYVFHNGANINLGMVQRGAAAPYFLDGVKGTYADLLLRTARLARNAGAGLWGACPSTQLNPYARVDTGPG
jgi:endonuclease YncB( thermonuclease family)